MLNDTFPQNLAQQDNARMTKYKTNLDFYHGQQWQGQSRERRLTFNYARTVIDKTTSYLMSSVTPTVTPLDDSPEEKARAQRCEFLIQQIYYDNDLDLLDFDSEIDCSVLGDGCFKVIWDSVRGKVKVTAPDIQGIYAWWSEGDMSDITRVASRYTVKSPESGVTSQWKSGGLQTIVEDWTPETFDLYQDNVRVSHQANPYGFIPFVIYPNIREPKDFWGTSDIIPLIEPQRELNRAISQLSRILEVSGNPIAVLENVEQSGDIAVKPGAVWNIPEDAKAYLLDLLQGGGVRLHLEYIDVIYRTIHDMGETPRAAFGGTDRDLSGAALQIEMYSLLQKVRRKRLIRSVVYRKRMEMMMNLLKIYREEHWKSYEGTEELQPHVVWGDVLPADVLRNAQAEQLLIQAGVHSHRRAMTEMGIINPDDEFNQWLEEDRAIREMREEVKKSEQ